MPSYSVEEAQARLPQLIEQLTAGEPVIITRDQQPIARLTRLSPDRPQPVPGRCKGMLTILAEDDDHLKDWAEYLP